MPLGSALNSLLLLAKNLDSTKSTIYTGKKGKPDKPVVFDRNEKINHLERGKPEDSGYSEEYINSFFNELHSDFSIRPNRIYIIKDNKIVAERYEHPYVNDSWDCVFSSSKTLVSLAIGLLYDEGKIKLDDYACKLLKNERAVTVVNNKKIKVRHLLTMSTGIKFNEMESASSTRWVKSFFDSRSKFKFGTKFEYNSMNTYILSAIVEKVSGMKFADFVGERIFKPLNMNSTHLDTSLEGYFKGGWGLYILPEDMAKLGILVRDNGVYNGQRILSEEWIYLMSHKQFPSTDFGHIYDYGFQMWVDEKNDICYFNGMYDQNIMIHRNSGIVVVTCCANNEAFHGSNLFKITTKYFAKKEQGTFELCKHPATRELRNYDELMYYLDDILNKEYKSFGRISNSCGILPLILQNELGTYAKGIKGVRFEKEGDTYKFIVLENHKEKEIKFNFGSGVRDVYDFYGNLFDCVCDARFILSGKSETLLVIRLFFLEFSSSRYFTIIFGKDPDVFSIELSENPGLRFVYSIIENQDESVKTFIRNLSRNINPALVSGTIKNMFSPSFYLVHGEAKLQKLRGEKEKKPQTPAQNKKKQ